MAITTLALVERVKENNSPHSVLVLIATLNEEKAIGPCLAELKEVLGDTRYLIVDGNSTDRTVEIAKNMGTEVLFQERIGKGEAIAKALKYIDSDVKYVALIDGDYTYPAGFLPEMLKILEDNPEVGMVTGNRFNPFYNLNSMGHPFLIGNRFLALVHRLFNGVYLRDPLTGLRVIRWQILKKWKPKSEGFDIETELNFRVENKGYEIVEIPIAYRNRIGEKKLKMRHGFTILKRILTESFSRSYSALS